MKDWKTIISNAPLALIALPAAYGSAAFESRVYGTPWNIGIGIGVEAAYTGIIFFANKKSKGAFLTTALTAMAVGVVYNMLHAADVYSLLNSFNGVGLWLLSLIHGAPLSVLAFSYGMLMHYSSDATSNKEQPQPVMDFASAADRITTSLHQETGEMWEAIQAINNKLDRVTAVTPAPAPAPVSVADLLDLPQLLEKPMEMEMSKAGQIQIMRNQDKTWKEIASHFGVSVKTVQNWAKEA